MNELPHPKGVEELKEDDIVRIPICCTEGHDDCPHVINKPLREKIKNIAV